MLFGQRVFIVLPWLRRHIWGRGSLADGRSVQGLHQQDYWDRRPLDDQLPFAAIGR